LHDLGERGEGGMEPSCDRSTTACREQRAVQEPECRDLSGQLDAGAGRQWRQRPAKAHDRPAERDGGDQVARLGGRDDAGASPPPQAERPAYAQRGAVPRTRWAVEHERLGVVVGQQALVLKIGEKEKMAADGAAMMLRALMAPIVWGIVGMLIERRLARGTYEI
jgi:hypothetical protein